MMRRSPFIARPPPRNHRGLNLEDGCSQSLLSQSDISDDEVNEGAESPIPSWQDDEVGVFAVTPHGNDVHVGFHETCQCPLPSSLQLPALEITFSLGDEDEHLSPSTVSCQNTAELPAAQIPALPIDYVPIVSTTGMPPYRVRCQRRIEELMQHASFDVAQDDRPPPRAQGATLLQPTASSLQASFSSSLSPPQQHEQQQQQILSIRGRFRPRSCLSPRSLMMLCAFILVILPVHDRFETSQRIVSDARIEEVAFPLHPEPVSTHRKAVLPKYYLPPSLLASAAVSLRDEASSDTKGSLLREVQPSQKMQYQRANLAMARTAHQARPVFVPDGGSGHHHSMNMERFVFDPQQQQKQEAPDQYQYAGMSSFASHRRNKALSWTSWLASVALAGMLLETGWREYQKYRVLEVQRRL
jgi:hypothetical protein